MFAGLACVIFAFIVFFCLNILGHKQMYAGCRNLRHAACDAADAGSAKGDHACKFGGRSGFSRDGSGDFIDGPGISRDGPGDSEDHSGISLGGSGKSKNHSGSSNNGSVFTCDRSAGERADDSALADNLAAFFSAHNFPVPCDGNEVMIQTEGSEFFISLLRDMAGARHHIHIVSYIIAEDPLGNLLADTLIDKALQGVEVRIIYDDIGCWHTPGRFFDRMRQSGVEAEAFMPVRFPFFWSKLNCRNHRKICVIDGKIGYIGGMNLALRYAKGGRGRTWCDTHIRVEGGVVSSLQRSFCDDWFVVTQKALDVAGLLPESRALTKASSAVSSGCPAQLVLSSPFLPEPVLMQGYVMLILAARKYIYMATPYFIPTRTVLQALCRAALSGIDVRILMPEHADKWFAGQAARPYIGKAFNAGVKFYLYTPGISHSKLLVCDDCICSCGSANIDFRSFENNCEANLFMYDSGQALRMKEIFLGDLAYCVPFRRERFFRHRTFLQRVCDSIIHLFSPLM